MKLTENSVRTDVLSLLHLLPGEILDSDNLFEFGLDSIRLLTLLEHWRDGGAEVSFVELAEEPTLECWFALLTPFPTTPPLANAA